METKHYLLLRPCLLWEVFQKALEYVRPLEDPHWRASFQMSTFRLQDVLQSALQPEKASFCPQMQCFVHLLPKLQCEIHQEVDPLALQPVPSQLQGSQKQQPQII